MRSFFLYRNDTRTKEQIERDRWVTEQLYKYGIAQNSVDDDNDYISNEELKGKDINMRSAYRYKENTQSEYETTRMNWEINNKYKYGIVSDTLDDDPTDEELTDEEFHQLTGVFNTIKEYSDALDEALQYILSYKEPPKELGDKLILVKKILDEHPEIYIDYEE